VHPKEITPKKEKSSMDGKKIDEINQEKKCFFRCARQNENWSLFNCYKQQRNKVVKEMRKAKGHFFKNFNPSSSKQFWKTVKILNKNNISIPALVRNGTTVIKDFDKASILNQYFSECFNMAQPPLSSRYEEPNIDNCPEDFLCTEEECMRCCYP